MRVLIFAAMLILAPSATNGGELQSYRWPQVTSVSRTFRFSDPATQTEALTIKGPSGTSLYWLGCHSGFYKGIREDPRPDDQYDYIGDLDCHLHSLGALDHRNLLVTDPYSGKENFSRLVTTASELQGECAKYPEWGAARHVTLRGMEITFTFKDAEIRHEIGGGGPGYDKNLTLASVRLEICPRRFK
jgi:hypothetical protein